MQRQGRGERACMFVDLQVVCDMTGVQQMTGEGGRVLRIIPRIQSVCVCNASIEGAQPGAGTGGDADLSQGTQSGGGESAWAEKHLGDGEDFSHY